MGIQIKSVLQQAIALNSFGNPQRPKRRNRFILRAPNRGTGTGVLSRWVVLASLLGTLGAPAQSSQTITLAWNPSSDSAVAGYFRYYGSASGTYTNRADVGDVTNASVSGLFQGNTYYFAVTAYDDSGLESVPSSEVSYTVPPATNSVVAPTITGQPASQTVPAGATASFQLTATGSAPLSYQWRFNGASIANATGSALTLNNVQPSQAGGYSAVVANSAGSVTSAVAQLTVQVPTNPPAVTITNPADGSSFTAPANIELDAVISPNGNTITKLQFYQGSTLLGEAPSAPYSMIWSNASAGDYTLTAVALYSATNASSTPIRIHVTGVPLPWQSADIGSPGLAGTASVSNGTYFVSGAGNLSGSSDNFHFLYQPLTGDGSITAQISTVTNTTTSGRFGVMIRESLTTGSRYAFMGISTNGKFRYQRRRSTSGSSSATSSSLSTFPNSWVRLSRSGGTFSAYQSTDGTNWSLVYSGSIDMAANPYVGLAVASGKTTVLSSAAFNAVTVVP